MTSSIVVNGGWTQWTTWGDCSVTCGGGTQTRSRTCDNPAPQYGGAQCSGDASGSQQCNTDNCPGNILSVLHLVIFKKICKLS
jgi:hypothetical protein